MRIRLTRLGPFLAVATVRGGCAELLATLTIALVLEIGALVLLLVPTSRRTLGV